MSAVERVCYFFLAIVFSFFSPINSIDVSNYLEHLLTKKGGGGGFSETKTELKGPSLVVESGTVVWPYNRLQYV